MGGGGGWRPRGGGAGGLGGPAGGGDRGGGGGGGGGGGAAAAVKRCRLLCDACWREITGVDVAECEDGCDLPLDHAGLCGPRPAGVIVRESCDGCTRVDRLHEVDDEAGVLAVEEPAGRH